MNPETRRGVGGISLGEHVVVILGILRFKFLIDLLLTPSIRLSAGGHLIEGGLYKENQVSTRVMKDMKCASFSLYSVLRLGDWWQPPH